MTDTKDGESFFRKVARFVANPTTDWSEINSRQDDPESDLAKAELRAMVERKRRNDFVRKRELDMLRRIRREGLTPEQLAALGAASSRIDETDRASEPNSRMDPGVKAKIDQIEQQMVGESFAPTQMRGSGGPSSGFFETSTRPIHFAPTVPADQVGQARVSQFAPPEVVERLEAQPAPAVAVMGGGMSPLSDAKPSMLPDLMPLEPTGLSFKVSETSAIEVAELVHDAELDEAVIAFANADNDSCERSLTELTQHGGLRALHAETWLVLFDFYRASGQQAKFEALALDYAQQFGLSAPQWFSMPKLVAESLQKERPPRGMPGGVSWTAPEYVDADSIAQLRARSESQPLPWVLDWKDMRQLDAEGCAKLRELFREWAGRNLDIRWLAGDHFLQQLKDLAPVGMRDVDPAFWMLRMEALRLVNRPDQFDEAAIDYCVTYEVSPPSWERCKCSVRVSGNSLSTTGHISTAPPPEPTVFFESTITEQTRMSNAVQLELSGQLSGDISETLKLMSSELGSATMVSIACPKLIRLDFMAAGDLLNWVLQRRSENRSVEFLETHRLVALFFGAMGINEHAKIKIRQI